MNIVVIQKPWPHCPIPADHPLFDGYVPADKTDIRRTWARSAPGYGDDYDLVGRHDYLSAPGGFR